MLELLKMMVKTNVMTRCLTAGMLVVAAVLQVEVLAGIREKACKYRLWYLAFSVTPWEMPL